MNTTQISKKLQNTDNFLGVYPCDKLPTIIPNKCGLIINTDKSTGKGEHWVAIFIDDFIGEYFDSFGFPPLVPEILDFLSTNCLFWDYNKVQLQGIKHSTCGQYTIIYLYLRLNNFDLNEYLSFFTINTDVNNYIIQKSIKLL